MEDTPEVTIKSVLQEAAATLQKISDAPRLDAERLLLHTLKQENSSFLYTHHDASLNELERQTFQALISERCLGKPLAYLLGYAEFYGRTFFVNENVLIPRPSTEELVDVALLRIVELSQRLDRPLVIADIGTGSGCVAITLCLERQARMHKNDISLIATDISPAALEVARRNAQMHGVLKNITFLEGDMLEPLAGREIDLIVSNPPYVPTHELGVPDTPETAGLKFEPRLALDGGVDGQLYIKKITASGIPAVLEIVGGRITEIS